MLPSLAQTTDSTSSTSTGTSTATTATTTDAPANYLLIKAHLANTWEEGETNVVQLNGPVEIRLDHTRMYADNAVIWLTPIHGSVIEQQRAEIALLGNARVEQDDITRSGDLLQVTGTVRGAVRVTADDRAGRDLHDSELYKRGLMIRPSNVTLEEVPATQPAVPPTKGIISMLEPITFRAPGQLETMTTRDGKLALILSGGVTLLQERKNGALMELQSDRAVLFTNIEKLTDLQKEGDGPKTLEQSIRSGYLEGDVRMIFTPAPGTTSKMGEQRLSSAHAFYDFTTDRAILTDVVMHATSAKVPVPMIVRAETVRMLSRTDTQAEYEATHAVLTTSEFATPSFGLAASKVYIREEPSNDPEVGAETTYTAHNVTMQGFGIPFFYMPAAAGTISNDLPLRSMAFGDDTRFGPYASTTWALFPSIGRPTPKDLDIAYTVGYWGYRGPGAGLEGKYGGEYISDPAKDPWSFQGKVQSFFVYDQGVDQLGGDRRDVSPEDEFRGHAVWEHQQFLPGDWQVQLRAGWVSDPNFLEEWVRREFYDDDPHDLSLYAKKQTDTEAFTILGTVQPNGFVTDSDLYENQFEVERYPEITYHRIGDSPFGDRFTFFSDNSVSALRFNRSSATLADLGYPANVSPGIPSLGLVGATGVPNVPEDTTYRGDFRQELDYPLTLGQIKAVPYVMERYTSYSTSPMGQTENRFYEGAGTRISTAFWKVNDTAESDLFDIHRIRHVVEPEVNLFTSASSVDADNLYIYDEDVDRINDITAAQLALHQTWQTKRGGPGRWRNVDFLTWNVEGDFFANAPPDRELDPSNFRGLFYDSLPEASIPRDAINSDAQWRLSDTLIIMGDESYNVDNDRLATGSLGMAVQRDPRVSYFFGVRYIDPLDSTIGTATVIYQMSKKYELALSQSYDFSGTSNVDSSVEVTRHFDKFWMSVRVYHDSINDQGGIGFLIYPEGLGPRISAASVGNVLNGNTRR
jgi:hypothetical protein